MNKIKSLNFSGKAIFSLIIFSIFLQMACLSKVEPSEKIRKTDSTKSISTNNYKPIYAKEFDLSFPTGAVKKEVHELLIKKDFEAIEKLANNAREKKERLIGGYWKLDSMYDGLTNIYSEVSEQTVTDQMWNERIELLNNWKKNSPDSITARVALALSYMNYGWFIRGFGYIDAVAEEDLKLLEEKLKMAENELSEAKSLNLRDARWYREALFLGMATGISQTDFDQLYEEAITFEPNYLQFYLVKSEFLTPKWSGKPGDWERYINSLANKIVKSDTDEKDIIFFVVVANKLNDPSVDMNTIMALRDNIYKGFNDLEKKYKSDKKRINQCAYINLVTSNKQGAKWAFTQIGDNWDKEVWGSETKFKSFKQAVMRTGAGIQNQ